MRFSEAAERWLVVALAVAGIGLAPLPALCDEVPGQEIGVPGGSVDDDPAADFDDDADDLNDPWEGMNRGIFWFNEKTDKYFLEPFAKVWDFLLPDIAQRGLRNVADNARFPIIFANNLLQAKPVAAAEDVGRFVVNTTVGLAGLWDPAKHWGLEGNNEDFGQTLGYWGVPTGPYLVLPFLGPSSPRGAVGLAADSAAQVYPYFIPFWVSATITGTNLVNRRSLLIEEIRENRASAFDFYVFVRNAYVSYRRNLVNDEKESTEESTGDLYYPVDDE